MANLLLSPASAIISFSNDLAGTSTFPSLTASSRFVFDGFGGVNLISKVPTTSSTNRMSIEGRIGMIFSVTEETTGTLLSINDAAGLPLFEINSSINDIITLGTFNTNTFVAYNSTVNIGTARPILPNARFSVSGITAFTNQIVFSGNTANNSTPASGSVSLFAKTDNKLYLKTAAGVETDLTSIEDSSWIPYTVSWTSETGTQPSLGNGTIVGKYRKIGKTVFVNIKWTAGSSTTYGDNGAAWLFSLPFNAKTPESIVLPVAILDNGSAWYQGTAIGTYAGAVDKTAIIVNSSTPASVSISNGTPVATWANSDAIMIGGSYECV